MTEEKNEKDELEKEGKEPELKNIKVTMEVKKWLDEHGKKGETYDQILRRYLFHEGKHSDIEEKIKKCAEDNKIKIWKIRSNDYSNIAKYIYDIGYENDDVDVDIKEFRKGWGNGLYYSVNGVTFAKLYPQYQSVIVEWLAEDKGKLGWGGMCTLKEADDFDTLFYNFHSDSIKKAYYLAKKIGSEMGDRYIELANRIATIEESLRKVQDELKTIKGEK